MLEWPTARRPPPSLLGRRLSLPEPSLFPPLSPLETEGWRLPTSRAVPVPRWPRPSPASWVGEEEAPYDPDGKGATPVRPRRQLGDRARAAMRLRHFSRRTEQAYLGKVRRQHANDLAQGAGWVELPAALGRKLPSAGKEWAWQWVFPATRRYLHPQGQHRRYTLLALLMLFLTSLVAARSKAFQALILKPGRSVSEIRPMLNLVQLISGVMLIAFAAQYLAS